MMVAIALAALILGTPVVLGIVALIIAAGEDRDR